MRALSTVAILFSVGCAPAALVVGSRDAGPPDAVAMVEVGPDVEPDIHPTPDARIDTGPPDATAGGCLVPVAALFDQLPYTVTGGDFNGDGNADLVIGDAPVSVQVYLGHGDGTFEKTNSALLANHPVAVGDLNGDGKLDVVATSEFSDSLSVRAFLGDGHGGFQDAVVTPISQVATGVAIADFDGDSHPVVPVVECRARVREGPGRRDGNAFGQRLRRRALPGHGPRNIGA